MVRWENTRRGKIKSIERLDSIFGWVRMKTNKDARKMMFGRDDINLIVVNSYKYLCFQMFCTDVCCETSCKKNLMIYND